MQLAHVQLTVYCEKDLQVLLCKAAFQPVGPQCVLVLGVIPPQMQGPEFLVAELHEEHISTFLQPIKGASG